MRSARGARTWRLRRSPIRKTTPQKIDARQIHGEGRWRSVSRRRLHRDSGTRRSASAGLLTRFVKMRFWAGGGGGRWYSVFRSRRESPFVQPRIQLTKVSCRRRVFFVAVRLRATCSDTRQRPGDGPRPWRTRSPRPSSPDDRNPRPSQFSPAVWTSRGLPQICDHPKSKLERCKCLTP